MRRSWLGSSGVKAPGARAAVLVDDDGAGSGAGAARLAAGGVEDAGAAGRAGAAPRSGSGSVVGRFAAAQPTSTQYAVLSTQQRRREDPLFLGVPSWVLGTGLRILTRLPRRLDCESDALTAG
jgi:hypothetical protein